MPDNIIEYRNHIGAVFSGLDSVTIDNRTKKIEIVRKTTSNENVNSMNNLTDLQVEKIISYHHKN